MPPLAASFLAQSVSSVTTWRVVLSPVFAKATFFVPRRDAISHISSCMMKMSRERFSRLGINSTLPQGVTYTAKDLITRSSPACTAERWLLLPVKPRATFIWKADRYTVSGLPPSSQIDCITSSNLVCENAVGVPSSVRASEPSPVGFAPELPDWKFTFVINHDGTPPVLRAAVEEPATLPWLANNAFSMSSFCSLAISNVWY